MWFRTFGIRVPETMGFANYGFEKSQIRQCQVLVWQCQVLFLTMSGSVSGNVRFRSRQCQKWGSDLIKLGPLCDKMQKFIFWHPGRQCPIAVPTMSDSVSGSVSDNVRFCVRQCQVLFPTAQISNPWFSTPWFICLWTLYLLFLLFVLIVLSVCLY